MAGIKESAALGRKESSTLSLLMAACILIAPLYTVSGDVEPNNDISTAEQITPGNYNGTTTPSVDNADCYRFDLTAGRIFVISCTVGPGKSMQFTVYKTDMAQKIANSSWLSPGLTWRLKHALSNTGAGTYYLVVVGESSGSCSYNFTFNAYDQSDGDRPGDAGDTFDTARAITPGTWHGQICGEDLEDNYMFNVNPGQMIQFNLSAGTEPGSLTCRLSNPLKQPLISDVSLDQDVYRFKSLTTSDGGGTYYLSFRGSNTYALDLWLADQNDGGTPGDAPSGTSNPRYVELDRDYWGQLDLRDTVDTYLFECDAGKRIDISFKIKEEADAMTLCLLTPDGTQISSTKTTQSGVPAHLIYNITETGNYLVQMKFDYNMIIDYSFCVGIVIDREPPKVAFSINPGTIFSSPNATIFGSTTDNFLVLSVQLSLDNITWVNCTGTSNWTGTIMLRPGENRVYAQANDAAGNIGHSNLSVILDMDPPELVIDSPANNTIVSGTTKSIDVKGTTSDKRSVLTVDILKSNGAWTTLKGTDNWFYPAYPLVPGENKISVQATNSIGNINISTVIVIVDVVPPHVYIDSPPFNVNTANKTMTVSGRATDNGRVDKVEVKVNGEPVTVTGLANWSANITLAGGKNNITVTTTDSVGLTATKSVIVTCTTNEPNPQPGFDALLLFGAITVGLVVMTRRRN